MPTKKEIAWSELKVGMLVVVSATILFAIVMLVIGVESPFADRYTLYTYLPNIHGLRTGATVQLDGVAVGVVKSYEFAEMEKGVRIQMRILEEYQDRIRTDSVAKLRSLGLLGDKYIEINQGTENGRVLKEGETVPGAPPLDLDQMIAEGTKTFDNVSATVENIKVLTQRMEDGVGTMGKLLNDNRLYNNLTGTAEKINHGQGTLGSFLNDPTLYRELSVTAANLRNVTEKISQGKGAAGKLLSDEQVGSAIENSVAKLEAILARMERGEGSLGKLSTDPALYNNLNSIVSTLKPVAEQISRGEGTAGMLVHDKELYENLNRSARELQGLIADIRKDPKKYLRIKFSIF